jgi:hypothetical protein
MVGGSMEVRKLKKLLVVALTCMFVFGSLAAVSDAGNGVTWWNNFCKATDNLWFKNHGQCVSWFAQNWDNGNDGKVEFCKWLQEYAPGLFNHIFDNLGDCINRGNGN